MNNCKKCKKEFEPIKGLINYCSLSCRNSRDWNESDKIKKSKSAIKSLKVITANRNRKYKDKVSLVCKNCNTTFEVFPSLQNSKVYCSNKCYLEDPHSHKNKGMGGYRNGSGRSKSGYYKGIYCGSTYELAWVIYQIDHNVNFKRFNGIITDGIVKYIPDFIIDNTIFEMKGYENPESVDIKTSLAKLKGYDVIVLRKDNLKKEFECVKNNYEYKNIWELYDNYTPKYSYKCYNCNTEFSRDRLSKSEKVFCSRSCAGKSVSATNKNLESFYFK